MHARTHAHARTQHRFTVDEDIGEVVIDVIREQGTEGLISVVYTITGDGATHREDFDADTIGVSPRSLVKDSRNKHYPVQILYVQPLLTLLYS